MRKRAAGIGIRMPTATHGEKSGAWLVDGGAGREHQVRVVLLYTILLIARRWPPGDSARGSLARAHASLNFVAGVQNAFI
jgi:hypothetical protein